jgi:hypothetical protein
MHSTITFTRQSGVPIGSMQLMFQLFVSSDPEVPLCLTMYHAMETYGGVEV